MKVEISAQIYLLTEVTICASKLALATGKTHMVCGGGSAAPHPGQHL